MKLSSLVAALAVDRHLRRAIPNPTAEPSVSSLARDLERVESIREIKDAQRSFAQFAQFGLWSNMSGLFAGTGVLQWGNMTTKGPVAIEKWLRMDAGPMDGVRPGSLNALVAENPLITLSEDGKTAKGRWNGIQFMGDGAGATRIQGGIYENELTLDDGHWKFSLMRYYPMFAGSHATGWSNVDNKTIPIIPYHFTPETTSPIPPAFGDAPPTTASIDQLAVRITNLNDEDDVRNLQNAYGYYVDRRMWTDVVELFAANSSVTVGNTSFTGITGVRKAMERMGPDGLSTGILNDHPIFDTIVEVNSNREEAIARGLEIGMIGDVSTHTSSWEFNVFRNHFIKDNGIWKFKELHISPLVVANYTLGWGHGSAVSSSLSAPAFLPSGTTPRKHPPFNTLPITTPTGNTTTTNTTTLARRLARAAAYDGAENLSSAYGYYLDDLRCTHLGAIHASRGHKASPGAGWFQTPARVAKACETVYGAPKPDPQRASIAFHWRPQPVILVAADGRSATCRSRLLQPGTGLSRPGAGGGGGGFNGAMYHDQMALEDGRWKLWSITIDEFYWESSGWAAGWAGVRPPRTSPPSSAGGNATRSSGSSSSSGNGTSTLEARGFPPDISLKELGAREATFRGGSGTYIGWPEIQHMWFQYRNPVSGRVPEYYWPGCVPCGVKKGWSLADNGYLEPPTGPTVVSVSGMAGSDRSRLSVEVVGGPGEPVDGAVELRDGGDLVETAVLHGGRATFEVPVVKAMKFTVAYMGSDVLLPGQSTIS